VCSITSLFSQSQNWWRVIGNTPASGDFLGTTNNAPLIIKTNNQERFRIDASGKVGIGISNPQYLLDVNGRARFRWNAYFDSLLECSSLKAYNLGGNGTALLMSDSQGNVSRFNWSGSNNDVLTGNGVWTNINTIVPPSLWQVSGQHIFYNQGNVGIGTNNPQYALDVAGDIRVSKNVYVGGGIVVADRVNSDTLHMGGSGRIMGAGPVEVIPDLKAQNKLEVMGNAMFSGNMIATQGVALDASGVNGLKFYANSNGGGTFVYGKIPGASPPVGVNLCAAPTNSIFNHQMGGILQVYATDNIGNYLPNGGLLNIQSFNSGGSSIDASIGGYPGGGLLINYFCGGNTYINTGSLGGIVSMGKIVEIGMPVTNTMIALNIKGSQDQRGIHLVTQHSQDYGFGIVSDVNRDRTKALAVFNSSVQSQAYESFAVWGNGYMEIKCRPSSGSYPSYSTTPRVFTIRDIDTPKDLFVVTTDGKVYGREVEVTLIQNFPDYVFDKEYKKMTLEELEEYIAERRHLPHFKKGEEYEKNGMNIGEILLKQQQTIEEMTLYILEQNKEIKRMKRELEEVKKKEKRK